MVLGVVLSFLSFSVFVFVVVPYLFTIPYYNVKPMEFDLELKTIIFDFDGTLVDTLSNYLSLANIIAEENGFVGFHNPDELRRISIGKAIRKSGMSMWQFPAFAGRLKSHIIENRDNILLFDGMKEAMIELSKKYNLGIITSNEEEVVDFVLQKYGIRDIFKFVKGTGFANLKNLLFGKSAVINDVMKSHGLKNNQVVYVGDEVRDITASRKSYIKVMSITHGFNDREYLETKKPDYIVDDTEDMLNTLNNL